MLSSRNIEEKATTASDLEPHRQKFEQLYIREKRSLKDVMSILKADGCNATRNMYLRKVQSWGLEKNNKYKDMVLLLEKINPSPDRNESQVRQVQHESQAPMNQKSKVLRIRNRKITVDQVHRYFERRNDDTQSIANSLENVIRLASQSPENQYIKPSITLPEPFRSRDRFFQSVANLQIYMQQKPIYHRRLQGTETEGDKNLIAQVGKELTQMSTDVVHGSAVISQGQVAVGGAMLARGFQWMEQIVQFEHPEVIDRFFLMVQNIHVFKLEKLLEMFTRHHYELSLQVLGPRHPMTCFAYQLFVHRDQLGAIQMCCKVNHDTIAQLYGNFNLFTFSSRHTSILCLRILKTPFVELAPYYESALRDSLHLPPCRLNMAFQRDYATLLMTNGQFQKGALLLHEVVSHMDNPFADRGAIEIAIETSYDLAALLMEQPQLEGFEEDEILATERFARSEGILKRAVERSILMLGPDSPYTLGVTTRLGQFYTDYGDFFHAEVQLNIAMEALKDFKLDE